MFDHTGRVQKEKRGVSVAGCLFVFPSRKRYSFPGPNTLQNTLTDIMTSRQFGLG